MSEPTIYRFACPQCQKLVRARADVAVTRGVCPHCKQSIDFPPYRAPDPSSATAQQLLKMLAQPDNASLDEAKLDRLALLLSQGTCRDYELADELLSDVGGTLSARQWRRTLNAADQREVMRLRLDTRIAQNAVDAEPLALSDSTLSSSAWQILARFVYFQRHPECEGCTRNPTGLGCVYLNFDSFLTAYKIPEARAANWRAMLQHHMGL